jgi:hypothetical protein
LNIDDYINQFWILDAEYDFSCLDTRFYFFLLDTAVSYKSTKDIQIANYLVCCYVGCTEKNMRTSRKKLRETRLITYEKRKGERSGFYGINLLFKRDEEEENLFDFITKLYKGSVMNDG